MSLRESGVQFNRFQSHFGGFYPGAPRRHCTVRARTEQGKRVREACIGQSVVGVVLNGAVKIINSLVQCLLGSLFRTIAALQVELISLGILCAALSQPDGFTPTHQQTQMHANLPRDFLLQFENVGKTSAALPAPKLGMGVEIHKLRLDVNAVAERNDATADRCAEVEFARHLCQVSNVSEAKRRLARNDSQLPQFRKSIDKAFRNALAKIFEVGIAAGVLEEQDCE